MNDYEILWDNAGDRIYRNTTVPDHRPSRVQAAYYELLSGPENSIGGIKFFKEADIEPFLVIFDVPLMVTKLTSGA